MRSWCKGVQHHETHPAFIQLKRFKLLGGAIPGQRQCFRSLPSHSTQLFSSAEDNVTYIWPAQRCPHTVCPSFVNWWLASVGVHKRNNSPNLWGAQTWPLCHKSESSTVSAPYEIAAITSKQCVNASVTYGKILSVTVRLLLGQIPWVIALRLPHGLHSASMGALQGITCTRATDTVPLRRFGIFPLPRNKTSISTIQIIYF